MDEGIRVEEVCRKIARKPVGKTVGKKEVGKGETMKGKGLTKPLKWPTPTPQCRASNTP